MRDALKVSTGLTEWLLSLPLDVYLVAVMKGVQPAVRWGLEGVSASHNLQEKTVIAAQMDVITILSAFLTLCTRQPPNRLQAL